MMQNNSSRISGSSVGVHFSQFQCNTILRLNRLGIMHFQRCHLDEASECFRSALLVLKRLRNESHAETFPVELKDSAADYEGIGHRSPSNLIVIHPEHASKDALSQPPGIASSSSEIVDIGQARPAKEDANKFEGRKDFGLVWTDESCILEPIELKKGHFPAFVESLRHEMDGPHHLQGMFDDREKESFSLLVMMILIFNLGVVMHTKAVSVTDEVSRESRFQIFNCALRLYRCVYECLLAAQEQLDDYNEQHEDTKDDEMLNADRFKETQTFFIRFHHMMLLCMLHNMGLVMKQISTRGNETSDVYNYLFQAIQQFRAEEEQNMNHSTFCRRGQFLDLLPSIFDLDLITGGVVRGLNILSNVITAPSA
jgi:hypothetical protein